MSDAGGYFEHLRKNLFAKNYFRCLCNKNIQKIAGRSDVKGQMSSTENFAGKSAYIFETVWCLYETCLETCGQLKRLREGGGAEVAHLGISLERLLNRIIYI